MILWLTIIFFVLQTVAAIPFFLSFVVDVVHVAPDPDSRRFEAACFLGLLMLVLFLPMVVIYAVGGRPRVNKWPFPWPYIGQALRDCWTIWRGLY